MGRHPEKERLRELFSRFVRDEFKADLRHALRNDLTVIRNASFYLRKKLSADGPPDIVQAQSIERMWDALDQQATVSEARLEPEVGDPSSAHTYVGDLLAAAARNAPVAVHLPATDLSAAKVEGNPVELEIAVGCLIENAREANAGDGVTIEARSSGDRLELAVLDGGEGLCVAEEDAMRRFFSTKPGHLGVGLNVAQRIAGRSGGSVALGPRPGLRGCEARLVLRVAS
jgi:signal transduction histidine kinase